MKTILAIFTSLVLAAGMAQAAIITNGNFDGGLSGWTSGGWGGEGYDSGVSHTADGSGSMTIKNASYAYAQQTVTVSANTDYNFSLWVKGPAEAYIGGTIVLMDETGTQEFYRQSGYITPYSGAWSPYGTDFNSGSYTSLTVIIQRYNNTDGTTYWADDVSVTPVPEPAALGLLAAGGLLVVRRRR